jgi:hypothetical protein
MVRLQQGQMQKPGTTALKPAIIGNALLSDSSPTSRPRNDVSWTRAFIDSDWTNLESYKVTARPNENYSLLSYFYPAYEAFEQQTLAATGTILAGQALLPTARRCSVCFGHLLKGLSLEVGSGLHIRRIAIISLQPCDTGSVGHNSPRMSYCPLHDFQSVTGLNKSSINGVDHCHCYDLIGLFFDGQSAFEYGRLTSDLT